MKLPEINVTQTLSDILCNTPLKDDFNYRMLFEKMYTFYSAQFSSALGIDKFGAVVALQNLMDEEIQSIPSDIHSQIKCSKGCSFCCHMPVTIGFEEAQYIGYYCKKRNIPISKKYLKAQLRFPEKTILPRHLSACVFLKNKTCSIYEARPLNCRKYLVYNEPEFCNVHKYPTKSPLAYFNLNSEAMVAASFMNGTGRLPQLILPFSK